MNRKTALIITLLLCLSAGIVSCYTIYAPQAQPVMSSTGTKTQQAQLMPPKETKKEEDTKKAVLPALPALPEPEVPAEDTSKTKEPHYRYTASHSSQRLFIRDGDSMRANIIGSLKPGDSGEVISLGETWVYLRCRNIEGYVFREYLSLEEIPQSEDLPES